MNFLKSSLFCGALVFSSVAQTSASSFVGSSGSVLLGFGRNTLGSFQGGEAVDFLHRVGVRRPKGAGMTALGLAFGHTLQPLSKLLLSGQIELLGGFVSAKERKESNGQLGEVKATQRFRVNIPVSIGVNLGNTLPYLEAGPLVTLQRVRMTEGNRSIGSSVRKWGVLLGAGLKVKASSRLILSVGYRYSQAKLKFKRAAIESALKGKMRNQEIMLGLGYKF